MVGFLTFGNDLGLMYACSIKQYRYKSKSIGIENVTMGCISHDIMDGFVLCPEHHYGWSIKNVVPFCSWNEPNRVGLRLCAPLFDFCL